MSWRYKVESTSSTLDVWSFFQLVTIGIDIGLQSSIRNLLRISTKYFPCPKKICPGSHTGLSSSDELPKVEAPVTCEPEDGVPTTGELYDPDALYDEPIIWDPKPVPEDPVAWTTETSEPVPILCGVVTLETCEPVYCTEGTCETTWSTGTCCSPCSNSLDFLKARSSSNFTSLLTTTFLWEGR